MSNSVTLPDHDAKPTATLSDRSSDTPYRCLLRAFAAYTLGVVLSVSILALFLRPWAVPLRTPVAYDWGDGKCVLALIQGILENGWYLHNDRLGAPFGLDMRGFPMVDSLHFGVIKLLSLACTDSGLLYNLYFILTFPLTTVSALFVMRRFGIGYLPVLATSLLYAFLPYHFLCGYCGHLFLAAYYVVPLTLLVAMWLFLGRFPKTEHNKITGKTATRIFTGRSIGCLLVCGLQASAGVYYAFFACFLILIAGVAACIRQRRYQPIVTGVVLVAITSIGVMISLAPTIVYRVQADAPAQAVSRWPIHAEMGALKITQLLLPLTNHRVGALSRLKGYYNDANSLLVNANDFTTLGIIGSAGFVISLFGLARRRDRNPSTRLLTCLGFLNVAAVLLATMGGFGSIFSTFISPWIRSYYRMSVFIAFLSLFSATVVAQVIRERYVLSRGGGWAYTAGMLLLGAVGILDQTSPTFALPWVREAYEDNREFISRIEATLPEGSRVFQLPYLAFPEALAVHGVSDYEPIRGYLHSRTLRWSYAAMRGSEADLWQARVAALSPERLVETLTLAGFSGIYLDRRGYADGAAALESKLRSILKVEPLVSRESRIAFYDLGQFSRELRDRIGEKEWSRRSEEVLHLILFSWENGFAANLEGPANDNWRWCTSRGDLSVINNVPQTRRVEVTMCCKADNEVGAHMRINGDLWSEELLIGAGSQPFTRTLTVPPGKHRLTFETDARIIPGIDPRKLVWRVTRFSAQECGE